MCSLIYCSGTMTMFYNTHCESSILLLYSLFFQKGYDDIVALLLKAEAPINCRVTEDLSTPLHKACAGGKDGHLAALELLLKGGADVHALNKWRETPLLTAANHGQAKAVEALLNANADPCKCTDTGWSPLSIAAYKGHDEVVKLLLEEDAPTEEADPTLSALLQAATKGLPDTVDLLLRHGADHTVTTKKGDTALSILVEQDLIDAAVDMVTEYNASIPRCSRDRKKVQRARLLINLQMKKREKEGHLHHWDGAEGSEPDLSEEDDDNNSALHDSDNSPEAIAPPSSKKRKKKGKKQKSLAAAEADAKAAADALLMELEQEETTAQKNEAKNESKRNKKKKKKERERQQKLQEEKARREKAEREAAEREKERQLQLEEERKAREKKAREEMEQKRREHEERQRVEREEKEKARKEAAEREEKEATKRKEKGEREKRQREQEKKDLERKERLERKATEASASQLSAAPSKKEKGQKSKNAKKQPSVASHPETVGVKTKSAAHAAPASQLTTARKRGWETRTPVNTPSASKAPASINLGSPGPPPPLISPSAAHVQAQPQFSPMPSPATTSTNVRRDSSGQAPQIPPFEDNMSTALSVEDQLEDMATGVLDFLGFDADASSNEVVSRSLSPAAAAAAAAVSESAQMSTPSLSEALSSALGQAGPVELPAVSIFQQEKVAALLQRCAIARSSGQDPMAMIDEGTLKTVIYRWIVRASHESSPRLDPIIPSWTDTGRLAQYLQRQFISESRRGMGGNTGAGMVNMEVLKDAGSTLTLLCQNMAKEVSEIRSKCAQQLPQDWSDNTINMSASEVMSSDGQSTVVIIDWAGRSQVYVPSKTFAKLRDRFRGSPGRLLTAIFSVAKQYETHGLIVSGSRLDYHLQPVALETMAIDADATVELWTSPMSVYGSNTFCGVFPEVDCLFGGLLPFGKEGGGGEEALIKHGGSIVAMPPLESTTSSLYMRTVLDSLERADAIGVPLSFAMVLPAECFPTAISTPSANDLCMLDPRLRDRYGIFVRRVEILPAGQHAFACGHGGGASDVSQSDSIFALMQNEAGKIRYAINDGSLENILRSMTLGFVPLARDDSPTMSATAPADARNANSFNGLGQDSLAAPMPGVVAGGSGALGGEVIGGGLGGDRGRRGRLFDLVDNEVVDSDAGNDVDVMSGMLNNLNVNMFQGQTSQDVDIEAISLMGIGSGALGGGPNSNRAFGHGSARGF